MNAVNARCPSAEVLSAFCLGKLSDAEREAVARHLDDGCPTCRQQVAAVAPDSFVGLVRCARQPATAASGTPPPASSLADRPPAPPSPAPELPPELAGHAKFRIVRELGQGPTVAAAARADSPPR
jgi:anti-sigma factor RsiW